MRKSYLYLCSVLFLAGVSSLRAQHYTRSVSDTWVATDALNRTVKPASEYGEYRPEKKVGIFYFLWMGAHGYDTHRGDAPGEGVFVPTEQDKNSPYDISRLLRDNPQHPQYGPIHAFHHWGEPYLGYYVSNDEWVIEKHIQLLADAGIDVLLLDNTNARIYLSQLLTLCRVMARMRSEGRTTPQLASVINSDPQRTVQRLYDQFYKPGLYKELWFYWKGKPLVLCPPEGVSSEVADFFTFRRTWFDSGQAWFGDGKNRWTWGDYYPQRYGWHESPEKAEEISVAAATHPMSNIGRSYHAGKEPDYTPQTTASGAFFAEQWSRVFEVDPEFVFITGWNEWIAMRMNDGASQYMTGKRIQPGDTYFVDQYNEEFSRDIEPVRGGFGDNYYYQMADFIRRYKGGSPVTTRQHGVLVQPRWAEIEQAYFDDRGDIKPRNHFGYGRIGQLVNASGRNDFVRSKVAVTKKNLHFYVETASPIVYASDCWMNLFVGIEGRSDTSWENFQFRVSEAESPARGKVWLQECSGGWSWRNKKQITYRLEGNKLEIIIPLSVMALNSKEPFSLRFKWMDNIPLEEGDIKQCMEYGDTAPNSRFCYLFNYQPKK